MKDRFWLSMSDGHNVFVTKWFEDTKEPRAILQLAHGMGEHIQRYDEFASFLVSKGIYVIGNDHRGHGQTGEKSGRFGFFADSDGFERVVEDLKEVHDEMRRQYPNVPIFIMGHSMGSFLVRRFIQRYQTDISGVILSGTGRNPSFLLKIAKRLAKLQMRKRGNQSESPFLNQLTTGSYNKKYENPTTDFEWLSRDSQEVKKYVDDPYCGKVATATFYYDLYDGLEKIQRNEEVKNIQKDIPFFVFSGDMDPVGNYTKGVKGVINQLKKHGIDQIDHKFYKEGRHEMLNELNREEVFHDINRWIDHHLKK